MDAFFLSVGLDLRAREPLVVTTNCGNVDAVDPFSRFCDSLFDVDWRMDGFCLAHQR